MREGGRREEGWDGRRKGGTAGPREGGEREGGSGREAGKERERGGREEKGREGGREGEIDFLTLICIQIKCGNIAKLEQQHGVKLPGSIF